MTRVVLRGLAARPLRTALTALAIVLGVAMVSAAFTFTDTTRTAADALSSDSYDGTAAVVSARTAFEVGSDDWAVQRPEIPASAVERVRQVPGVSAAVGDITDYDAKIIGKDGKPLGDGPYFGVGFDAGAAGAERLTPFRLEDGRWAAGPSEVVIDAGTAEKEGYGIGDRVAVAAKQTARYEVVGVARFASVKSLGTATVAVFDLPTAQKALGQPGSVDSVLVAADEGVSAAQLRGTLAAELDEFSVSTAAAHDRFTFDGLKMFVGIIKTVLLIFGGVAIVVGAFTIFNSLSITVAQRTRELGQLRMAGASRRQVLGAVLSEALVVGVLASVVGLFGGLGLAEGLSGLFSAMGLELPTAETVFATRTIVVAMALGVLVTLFAGLVPAWRATRVPPVAALQGPGDAVERAGLVKRAVRAVAGAIARPVEKAGGTAGMLARRNSMRHPGRTAATAAALTIGVALMTAVAVIGAGLKDSTKGSLERRIAAEYVLIGEDGWSPVDVPAVQAAASAPGVESVAGIKQDGGQAFGDVEVVNGIEPGVASLFRFDWAEGDDSIPASLGADGAIVDEGWAEEHGLAVGDSFTVTSSNGTALELTVRGIESSPVLDAMSLGPITVGEEAFSAAFSAEKPFITFVGAPESAGPALDRALAAHPAAAAEPVEEFIASRTADVDTLLAIFAVLLALAVIISLFGIVNTLVLATFERTRELGMLRAVGMTRRQMRRMVRGESIVTALLGASTGMVIGLGLAAVATSLLADEGLTFAVPVTALIVLTVVAVLAGVLAAILPARRASRLDVLTALAYE